MTAPVAATEAPTRQPTTARSPTDAVTARPDAVRVLDRVPAPGPDETIVALSGLVAGGFEAIQAEWGLNGGEVVLSARRPFVDVTARASFGSDGMLDGRVALRARVGMAGLDVAETAWSLAGWTTDAAIALPRVGLSGTRLDIELAGLPAEVTVAADPAFALTRADGAARIDLPASAVAPGLPLSERYVELYRGLLGIDLGDVSVHEDAAVPPRSAVVGERSVFFGAGVYGIDTAESLRLLDDAIRAVVAGLSGTVGERREQTVSPTVVSVPTASTDPVPASPPGAEVPPTTEPGPGAGGAGVSAAPLPSAGDGVAVPDGEPAVEGSTAPPVVEVLMPEAPTAPGPAAAARGGAVAGGAGGAARGARDLPDAAAMTDAARGAVTEPAAETAARAREELAAELGERAAPSPEIVELCERIRTAIRENRPEDEDELLRTDPTAQARSAGATVTGSVDGQVTEVSGAYDQMATPPAGAPALTPTPVTPPPTGSPGMGVDAATAAPDAIPADSRRTSEPPTSGSPTRASTPA